MLKSFKIVKIEGRNGVEMFVLGSFCMINSSFSIFKLFLGLLDGSYEGYMLVPINLLLLKLLFSFLFSNLKYFQLPFKPDFAIASTAHALCSV